MYHSEPVGSAAPKFPSTSDLSSLKTKSGLSLSLPCPAQASPLPFFRWSDLMSVLTSLQYMYVHTLRTVRYFVYIEKSILLLVHCTVPSWSTHPHRNGPIVWYLFLVEFYKTTFNSHLKNQLEVQPHSFPQGWTSLHTRLFRGVQLACFVQHRDHPYQDLGRWS